MRKYIVRLSSDAKNLPRVIGSCLLAIEPEDYSKKEIADLKAKGYILLGYLSVGSVSDERDYYSKLKPYTLGKLEDWDHERYLNVAKPYVQKWLINRGKEIINMGFNGLWIDNLDVYEYYKTDSMFNGISYVLGELKKFSSYIMVNGGSVFARKAIDKGETLYRVQVGAYSVKDNAERQRDAIRKKGVPAIIIQENGLYKVQVGSFRNKSNADNRKEQVQALGFDTVKVMVKQGTGRVSYIDGITQEEVFSLINDYSGKGKFGKQSSEETKWYKECLAKYRKAGIETYLLEYTRDASLKNKIIKYCNEYNSGYCISDDVNL